MTSKEALYKLKDIPIYEENNNQCSDLGNCCDYKGDLIEVYNDEINYIEKDLEVLEIIKKHKLLNYVIKNPKCAKMYHLTEDEIEKLKKWLENE